MFIGKVAGTLVLLSILLSSYAFSPVVGHHEGLPTFLGVWVQTPTMSGHRVIDTTVTGGNVTVNLNVTSVHRGGFTGTSGFDIRINYDPSLFKARAAGVASFSISAAAPSGAILEPICSAASGCILDLPGRLIVPFRVDLDMTFNAASSTLSSTPGTSRVFVSVGGANAAASGVALRFRLEARSIESVVYDTNNNNAYDTGEPVIAGATPTAGATLTDDPRIKFHDRNGNLVWAAGEGVVYTSSGTDTTYNPPTDREIGGGVPPPAGQTGLRDDSRIKFVNVGAGTVLDIGPPAGSSDLKIDQAATQITTVAQQVRYIKLDGFFSNQVTAPNYIVSVAPNAATVAPTQGATATVTVGSPLGTPGSVSFVSSRVVSPLGAVEFPTGDPSVGLSLSPATGTPPFTSTLFITTTKDTVRGTHTILLNATSSSIPGGVITSFILTVEYPPIDFTATVSRNLMVLRPGENSPDVLFIDSNRNGHYDSGEPLVLDANLDIFTDPGDRVVSVTPHRTPSPGVRFIDDIFNFVYDLGETLVFDANLDKAVDSGDRVVSVTPHRAPNATELGKPLANVESGKIIGFIDANSNNAYDFGEKLVLDSNQDGFSDSAGDILVSESPPRSPTGTEVGATLKGELGKALKTFGEIGQPLLAESRIMFIDGNANTAYDLGETLVFDADNSNTVGSGDTVVSQSPPRAPTAGELGLTLLSAPKVRFIDLNGNNAYSVGETLVFDSQPNAVVDASDTVVSASQRTPIARIKFIDGAPGSGDLGRFNAGEKLVLDADHSGAVSVGDIIVSTDPPTAVIAGNPDIGKPLLEVEIVLTVTWASPITGTSLKDDVKIRYVDNNNNNVWDPGERVFYDSNSNMLYDVAEPMIAGAAPSIGSSSKDDPKIRYVDRDNINVRDLNEYVNYDTNSNGVYDSGEPVILGAGPEVVSLFPPNPHPVDSTIITELARSSGDVSGPAVPGVETKTLITTVKLKTLLLSGTQTVAAWTRLPVTLTVSVGARSDVSGVAKTADITLILAKEGYRTDLPFDYKLTVHSDTPLPAPAAASGIRVQLDKGQTITLTLTVNATQGIPQNVTITILTVDPTITITVTGITHSTTVLSSWVTTITISTTTLTPSVTGGYTIVTASPGGGSPPTPADEVIKLCVLFQGDVNDDGVVNFIDLGLVGASFLKSLGQPGFNPAADVNKDNVINFLDLGIIGSQFLRSC